MLNYCDAHSTKILKCKIQLIYGYVTCTTCRDDYNMILSSCQTEYRALWISSKKVKEMYRRITMSLKDVYLCFRNMGAML